NDTVLGITRAARFMLAARRALGLRVALISGILLIVDPNYFFLGLLDWDLLALFFVDVLHFGWRCLGGNVEICFIFSWQACFSGSAFLTKSTFSSSSARPVLLPFVFMAGQSGQH